MTTLEKVCEIILKIKKKTLSADDLKPEASLVGDLGMDSLDLTEMLVMAEEAFSIKISLDDTNNLTTVSETVKYLDKRIAERG